MRPFGRNRRRGARPERRALTLAAWRLARVVVPAALFLLAWPAVGERVRTHPYFAIREVVVQRRGHVTEDVVRRWTGLTPGMSIWDVDAAALEAKLAELPWVRTARVRRELPDRVVIRVREYHPVAIVRVEGAERPLYYLAADGRIFAPVEGSDGRDLPYVSGIERADLDGGGGRGVLAVREALDALSAAADTRGLGLVSEVHVDAAGGVTVVPARPPVPIHLGRGDYATKLARAAEVLPRWRDREAELLSVRCEFEDQVIVRLRHAVGGVGA
ncbi:MAG TPA: FtsQ-type POTRA domain-containing protein [Candidatus Limnocylindria bacterium]|nr:FtsQ-type POTRA domain-containing protein [Candidatus Limnocylindria bacterium]